MPKFLTRFSGTGSHIEGTRVSGPVVPRRSLLPIRISRMTTPDPVVINVRDDVAYYKGHNIPKEYWPEELRRRFRASE